MENILRELVNAGNYITVNKTLIKLFGLDEAILIGELASKEQYWSEHNGLDEEGYFYNTADNFEEETTISPARQRDAFKNLENMGILKTKKKGIPCKKYFKIDYNKLLNFLTTSNEKNEQLDVKKVNGNNIKDNNIKEDNIKYNITSSKDDVNQQSTTIDNSIDIYNQYTNCCNKENIYNRENQKPYKITPRSADGIRYY